jgi:hypothetical protein
MTIIKNEDEEVFCVICHVPKKKIYSVTINCEHEFCPKCMANLMSSHIDYCDKYNNSIYDNPCISCPICKTAITSLDYEEDDEEDDYEEWEPTLSQLLLKNLRWRKRREIMRKRIERRKESMERKRKMKRRGQKRRLVKMKKNIIEKIERQEDYDEMRKNIIEEDREDGEEMEDGELIE